MRLFRFLRHFETKKNSSEFNTRASQRASLAEDTEKNGLWTINITHWRKEIVILIFFIFLNFAILNHIYNVKQ